MKLSSTWLKNPPILLLHTQIICTYLSHLNKWVEKALKMPSNAVRSFNESGVDVHSPFWMEGYGRRYTIRNDVGPAEFTTLCTVV